MIHKIKTYTIDWLIGHEITIEIGTSKSLPTIEVIGLPDAMIRESKERIRSALRNSGMDLPARKFILNLSPSDIRKSGTSFDLPMSVGLIRSIIHDSATNVDLLHNSLFFGEVWLDGQVKRIDGLLPMVIAAKKTWYRDFFVPEDNLYELEYIEGIRLYPIRHCTQLIDYFVHNKTPYCIHEHKIIDILNTTYQREVDMAHIKGQYFAKRALTVAASGLHNIMMIWPPWSGKTMLAKWLHSILPPLNHAEILEVSQIYSVVGKLDKDMPLVIHRPLRSIHHTASRISIVGWGSNLRPWEVSLAHRGVLFMDELTEFPRETLEVLRQPIEDKAITISRVTGSVNYPASFMFVSAMNPCKCGHYKDPYKQCICSFQEIKRYQSKISGPLLDRIDMIMEIPRENINTILDQEDTTHHETSDILRAKVIESRTIQQRRYEWTGIHCNAQLSAKHIQQYIKLEPEAEQFLKNQSAKMMLSTRVIHRLMKLGRSIADMDKSTTIWLHHIAEAFQYRNKGLIAESEWIWVWT